jgi:hypothetical protein
VSEESSNPNLHVIDRRAHKRILANIPIEVTAIDGNGHLVAEHSFIEDVSDFGCRFSARVPVHQGDTVALKILGPHGIVLPGEEPRYYEIMWVSPKDHGATMGGRVIQGEKLASVNFPWESHEQKTPVSATLERRTESRLILHAQVEISGISDSGEQFAERSSLEDVSALGCRFSIKNALQSRVVLGIEPLGERGEKLADEFPHLFVVLWVKPNGDRLTVGARSFTEKELTDSTGASFSLRGFLRNETKPQSEEPV